jgi:lysophospholipase L1-like esterase
MKRPSAEGALGIGLAIGALALVAVLVIVVAAAAFDPSATPDASRTAGSSIAGSSSPSATLPSPADAGSPSPLLSSSPAAPTLLPTASAPATTTPSASIPLPTMLGAIGDSYTQAWGVSPAYPRDHPGFSWAIGGAKGDGVFSLRERFVALGDKLTVVNAATSGRKMDDAVRQATRIVSFARALPAGSTVYVVFELGTNDMCNDPTTDPAVFDSELRDAMAVLEDGLPKASRMLMLSVPDFAHFYDITQADPTALAFLNQTANSKICSPFLGSNSPLSLDQARQILAAYDASLARVCGEIEASRGRSGALHCTYDEARLSFRDYTVKDLTTVDFFHPSLSGQAKLATDAWLVGPWANLKLPAGAAH